MKKTAKPSSEGKSPREEVGHSRPKRRTRSSFLLEADIVCLLCFELRSKGTFPTGVLSSDFPLRAFHVESFLDTHVFAIKLRLKEVLKLLPCFDL